MRINEQIRAREVRLIGADGTQLGIVPLDRALEQARNNGLDLVEVAPNSTPPVCKIMDYGKYRYELKKKEKENKKKSRTIIVKEISLHPRIDEHDLEHKIKFLRKFLEQGYKVKVNVRFRGREMLYPELGSRLIEKVEERVADLGAKDREPKLEGYNMMVYFNPTKK